MSEYRAASFNDRENDRYLTKDSVKRRYGNCSNTTLWRWQNDPSIGFPAPDMVVSGKPYWLLSKLERFERASSKLVSFCPVSRRKVGADE